jgi:hypothetical protein
MKLKTADHINIIIQILSAGSWLLDRGWAAAKGSMEYDEITLPDRATRTSGGFIMVEVAPKSYVESDRPMWKDRADWEKSRDGKRLTPPLAKSWFKRQGRKKSGSEIVRTFSTPASDILVKTYEANDTIVRIEIIQRHTPYMEGRTSVIQTLTGNDIPTLGATAASVIPTYDVVTEDILKAAIIDAAVARLIAEEDYSTRDEIFQDFPSFDLEAAIHHGFPLSQRVEDDLSKIEFSAENTLTKFDAPGFEACNTIGDFTFFGVMSGGDWEHPIVFILYLSNGELRGFIPEEGNTYNHSTMQAYGNGEDEDQILEDLYEATWDSPALRGDIAKSFAIDLTNGGAP